MGRQSFAVRQLSLDGTPDVQSWQTGGWVQSPMQAAYLGLPKAAAKLVSLNFADQFPWFGNNRFGDNGNTPPPQPGHPRARFPAFWETKMDYTPDSDHGANSANGLQSMILQANDRQIYLLPAWPEDWDVEFKLHAPYQTTVEGVYRDGKVAVLEGDARVARGRRDRHDHADQSHPHPGERRLRRPQRTVRLAADGGRSSDAGGRCAAEDHRPLAGKVRRKPVWRPRRAVCRRPMGRKRFQRQGRLSPCARLAGRATQLPALPKKIVAASVLTGGQVTVKEDGQDLLITLPAAQRDKIDTIIKLELEGPM